MKCIILRSSVIGLLVTLLTCQKAPASPEIFSPPGRLIKVNEARLHIYLMGSAASNKPPVVLVNGMGCNITDWVKVMPEVAQHTRVCAIDRRGLGWSDPGEELPTESSAAEDMHELLDKAGIGKPRIFVGHSRGGKIIATYAHLYPDEVAGLVFVDPGGDVRGLRRWIKKIRFEAFNALVPGFWKVPMDQWGESFSDAHPALYSLVRPILDFYLQKRQGQRIRHFEVYVNRHPKEIRSLTRSVCYPQKPETLRGGFLESMVTWMEDTPIDPKGLGGKPVTLLSAHKKLGSQQKQYLALSSNSRWLFVQNSGHFIQLDRPGAVIDAIASTLSQISGK